MKRLSLLIHKFFDIRDGELSVTLWMQFYIFLIICALLIVKPTVNALFLSELGADSLAVAYIITAVVAVIFSYAYNKSLEKFPLRYTIRTTLLLFSVCFIVMGIIVALGAVTPALAYLFYILVGMFALLATSQFWVMANVVFNVREAKRLFGFIGAGGIVGGIVGGYATSLLASTIGNETLIIIAGFMIAGCALVFQNIWKTRVQNLSTYKRKERATVSTESSIKLIYKSKHLTYLAAVIGIGVLVAKLVDYQFSYIAAQNIPDPQELASFFGFWFSTFNIASLVIQLFLTRQILERSDIGVALVVLPVGVIFCCMALIAFPELWLVILLKGLDGSLKQSLHKSSVELLSLPIPSDVKNKTKTFIDVAVDSLATGAAGIFLIFIIKGLELPAAYITALTIILVIYWIFIVFKVRNTYLGTFKDSIITREQLEKSRKSSRQIRKNMKLVFETGSDKDILALLNRVPEVAHPTLTDSVLALLDHNNNKIKAAAIDNLMFLTKKPLPQIQDLIYIKDDDLIVSVMEYLLSQDRISYQFFEQYLDYEDDFISTAALLALARDAQDNPRLAAKYNLHLRVSIYIGEMESTDSHLRVSEIARLVETLGFVRGPKYHEIINRFLHHKNPILKTAAIHASGFIADDKYLPVLIELLEDFSFRESVITAITQYGNSIIPYLEKEYGNEDASPSLRMNVPEIIARLRTERAYQALIRIARKGNYRSRTKATELLHDWRKEGCTYSIRSRTLRNSLVRETKLYRTLLNNYYSLKIIERSRLNPDKVISLPEKTSRTHLINQVRAAMEQSLRRIFNLLALYYDPDDVFVAYRGLMSETKESKFNALEYLDGMLGRNLKTMLFPIIESGFISADLDSKDYHSQVDLMDQEESLFTLSKIGDHDLDYKVIDLLKHIDDNYSIKMLIDYMDDKSLKIAQLAEKTLADKNVSQQIA